MLELSKTDSKNGFSTGSQVRMLLKLSMGKELGAHKNTLKQLKKYKKWVLGWH
jgi:hypothetical protein